MAIFNIPTKYIKSLNEVSLPQLVYQIMYYEISRLNLLNKGLHISLNTKTGDGGSDGEFHAFNKAIPNDHPFLPQGNIVFQFKAATIDDKVWFEKEVLVGDKTELKPKLKELINDNYTYILITNQTDLPANKLEAKEQILKEIFENVGYQNVNVKIIDLTKLAEWVNSIPQIYLTLNPSTKYFELFENFVDEIKDSSENLVYINDENREKSIMQIQAQIETSLTSGKASFIRVEGFSGIGKTRLVFEALNHENFSVFTLYIRSYLNDILGDLISFCKTLPDNSQELVIFVIDECSYNEHVQICRHLKTYPNIVVITIDQVLSEQDQINCKEEYRVKLEGLSEEKTTELIQNANSVLPPDIAKKIAYFTEGYPRLAKFMAESFDIEKGDTNDPDYKSSLLNRIIDKVTDSIEEIKILQAISMFKMFPYTDDFKTYKPIIFKHFNIDLSTASITIDRLTRKGIIRKAGRFLYISPRPISIHLFNQFLATYDYDFINELFEKLNNTGLMNSFFEKLQSTPFDASQHKELLYQILSNLTYEQISDEFGAKIFYTLCLKDKKHSVNILSHLLENKTTEDLLHLTEGRRYLVFALEQLISFKETFEGSANILFRLAVAENESWGNNAKGTFIGSFQWLLGGTEVNIVNRLDFLQRLYHVHTEDQERIVLQEALKNSYPKFHYSATHKNYPNIPENIPDHYYPSTQGEIVQYLNKLEFVIKHCYEQSSAVYKPHILNDVISSLRSFLFYPEFGLWILDFIEAEISYYDQLKSNFFEEISTTLKYEQDEKLSDEIIARLNAINDNFFNPQNTKDIKELLYTTSEYRYNSSEEFTTHLTHVANDIFIDKNFQRLLDQETENTYAIGQKLAEIDKKKVLYEDVLNLIKDVDSNNDLRFVKAYLLSNINSKYQKLILEEIYKRLQDKSLVFDFIHSMNPKEKDVTEYLYFLIKNKDIPTSYLTRLTYGFWLRDLDKETFIDFIDHVNGLIENKCHSFELCMQYIFRSSHQDKNLVEKYTNYYIENGIFTCKDQNRISHHLNQLIDKYFFYDLVFSDLMLSKVWEAILDEFSDEAKFDKREFSTIYKIIQKYPNFFWIKIKTTLDELQPDRYPLYSNFVTFMQGGYLSRKFTNSLFNFIDSNEVLSWLKSTTYEKAKYIVADSFNIDFKNDSLPDIVLKVLTEFPDDEKLYFSIKCNSESWSGSYVPVADEKISNIDKMIDLYRENDSVLDFLKWSRKSFEYDRERAQRDDEERDLFD